jgi:hypothetical protein
VLQAVPQRLRPSAPSRLTCKAWSGLLVIIIQIAIEIAIEFGIGFLASCFDFDSDFDFDGAKPVPDRGLASSPQPMGSRSLGAIGYR